jgi:multiple sugar transport system permease protein
MADGTSVRVGVTTPAMVDARRAGTMKRFAQRRSTTAFLLCLPLILLVAGFVVYPAFYAIWLSLLNKKMTEFVGLSNFAFLLKRNTFQLVIFQSCLFAITAVIAKAMLGFIIAHLMHNIPGKNQRIWRGLLLVPWVVPLALSTLTWWWMFDPSYSAFNWILEELGLSAVPWLGVGWIAIDGANAVQKLFFVTLPMMRNIIAIIVLFSLIVTFADFDIVRILTGGGPQDMTHVFATYAFQVGIQSGDIPLGASVSLFMFPILAIAAFFVLRGVTRRTKEIAA